MNHYCPIASLILGILDECLGTSRKWLHELGFHVLDKKKGIYIDGHEREDVIQHRKKFLHQMIASGFLLKDHALNDEAKEAFPSDLESPTPERRAKNILSSMMSQLSTPTMISPYSGGHLIHKLSGQKVVDLALWYPTLS